MSTGEITENKKYKVYLYTRPAPGSEYYEGHVEVWARDTEEAQRLAIRKLVGHGGAFQGYPASAFKITQVRTAP